MPNVNILTASADGATISAEFHYATPVGNNAVGIAWTAALANSGLNKSAMTVGSGPGQLSTSDSALVASGALRALPYTFQIIGLSGMSAGAKQAAVTAVYNAAIAADQTQLETILNYFGYTQ